MLLLLWLWQGAFNQFSVKTIPYSEFKQDVQRRKVAECVIKDNVIEGKIQPKPAEAVDILTVHRDQLDRVSAELLKVETLAGQRFLQLIGRESWEPKRETTPTREPDVVGMTNGQ